MRTFTPPSAFGRWTTRCFHLRKFARAVPTALMVMLAVGCGGGSGSDQAIIAANTPMASTLDQPKAAVAAFNGNLPDAGLLMLLVPDNQSLTDPLVTSWTDAASELGMRLAPITDSQFLALGTANALKNAALVLPDQLHSIATDAIVTAIRNYTQAGGRTMLTYDFAALTLNGAGQPVYPIPQSRLSDLAGVNYVLYDALRGNTVGLGPITAMRTTMRDLLVPPGKSVAYTGVTSPLLPKAALDSSAATTVVAKVSPRKKVLDSIGLATGEALYLPVSVQDPGGVHGFDPQQFQNLPMASGLNRQTANNTIASSQPKIPVINFGQAHKGPQVPEASKLQPESAPVNLEATGDVQVTKAAVVDTLDAYSGYLLGDLIYPSYVTTGAYAGKVIAASPQFGLVSGINTVGKGRVFFVNLPLTYLKGSTDALMMHGYLSYFAKNVLQTTRLSAMPNAVAGLTFDWHLDAMSAQAPALALETAGIFNTNVFSMEMTAGPDTIVPGDGLGWNLDNNLIAQQFLKRMGAKGHAIGAHGGWIHDYYGTLANETNQTTFLPYLVMNKASIDAVMGRPMRSYSAPEGNNPTWAMTWLEQQGVVGTYFGGHTGLGATRQYRDGVLKNPAVWVFPVTPEGLYATFEEFQEFNVPKQDVITWYQGLVDFSLAQNTSRLIYAHPPGAYPWIDVVQNLFAYTAAKGAAFKWYTMPRLADFMTTRSKIQWHETALPNSVTGFSASHPASLAEMVWMLPKARYLQPTVDVAGTGTVADGGNFWLVKANAVGLILFRAKLNPAYVPA